MKILVNGAWREARAATLSGMLEELGYRDAVVSTAVTNWPGQSSPFPFSKVAFK